MKNTIELKAINELLQMNFFIPNYQRGYRWGKQEVTDLLDDIYQYATSVEYRDNKVSKFYCLQPIVVKPLNNDEQCSDFEIIDGQQRLTTLYIILTYLQQTRKILFPKDAEKLYWIKFETRTNSELYLKDSKFTEQIDDSNVDFYHISKAYQHTKEWFNAKDDANAKITTALLKSDYNVSVIWYKVECAVNSIELFTRLNQGKIPLTDSELIKALLLQSDRYPINEQKIVKQRLFEIASEWDEIEVAMSDKKMWLFLSGVDYKPTSKIEYIFNILAEKWNKNRKYIQFTSQKPKHYEYLVFDRYLESKRTNEFNVEHINDIWKEVKDIFCCFQYWFNDHELFHYIGYLSSCTNVKVEKLLELSQTKGKKEFVQELKNMVGTAVQITEKNDTNSIKSLQELTYGQDNERIIKILLLFNVDALIKYRKENAKFPFHLYKEDKIRSIEHIHPQNPESIDANEDRAKVWLENHKISLPRLQHRDKKDIIESIIKEIDLLIENYDKDRFKALFELVIELYSEVSEIKEKEKHTLYNLALVDKDTNSSLNNSFFDIKRDILKTNANSRYIPICTQRVFSKYYSESPTEMIFWSENDRESYFNAINQTYKSYIDPK